MSRLKAIEKEINDNADYYMHEGHQKLEDLEHQRYLLKHPEYKPLADIRNLIFKSGKEEEHQKQYILSVLNKNGYEFKATDTYGNIIELSDDANFINVYMSGKKVGALSFINGKRISMFSCNQ